jgi:D-alanine-D-alanine ligase
LQVDKLITKKKDKMASKKPNVAVIAGGDSSEFIVSVKSGANVVKAVNTEKFQPWLVQMKEGVWEVFSGEDKIADVDKSDFSFMLDGEKVKFDFAYISIHGTPGEDGTLQGYFEMLGVPYSTCNVQSSALTFNKWFCNNFLRSNGVLLAKSKKLKRGDVIDADAIIAELGLPAFVKPNAGGSSFGVTKVKETAQLVEAVEKAWKESEEALIEQFIDGHEFTCGVVRINNEKIVFPITEVLPKNEFFDFEAKYTPGATEEITPARLPEDQFKKCQALTSQIYDLCECSGIVRVDFIKQGDEFYFLEVNTTPGMTATSFIPQQIAAMGSTLGDVITQIIEDKLA